MSQRVVRSFSTASGVHPAYLPSLHKASRLEKKLVPAAVATAGIAYGLAKYRQLQLDDSHAAAAHLSSAAAPPHQPKSKSHSETLLDAYGGRATLADIEAAMKAYEEQRPQA